MVDVSLSFQWSPLSESGHAICCKEISIKIKNRIANSVDPDEMAHYEPLIWIYTVCISICFGLQG